MSSCHIIPLCHSITSSRFVIPSRPLVTSSCHIIPSHHYVTSFCHIVPLWGRSAAASLRFMAAVMRSRHGILEVMAFWTSCRSVVSICHVVPSTIPLRHSIMSFHHVNHILPYIVPSRHWVASFHKIIPSLYYFTLFYHVFHVIRYIVQPHCSVGHSATLFHHVIPSH